LTEISDPVKVLPEPLKSTPSEECLRVYHAQLDLLNSIFHPDQSDLDWQIERLMKYKIRKIGTTEVILIMVVWIGGDKQ
jgi:hypothetical protein